MTYHKLMKGLAATTLICLVLSGFYPIVIAFQLIVGLGILAIVMLLAAKDIAERGER